MLEKLGEGGLACSLPGGSAAREERADGLPRGAMQSMERVAAHGLELDEIDLRR